MFSSLSSCKKETNESQSEITASKTDTAIGEQKQKEQLDNEKQDDSEDNPQKEPFKKEDITALIGTTTAKYTVGEDRYDIACDAYHRKNATLEDYRTLVTGLQEKSLTIYTNNGENGIDGACYQTTLFDASYTVNVTYYSRTKDLYLTVEKYRPLSPYQIAPTAIAKVTGTVFHMPEMPTVNGSYKFGECEIFQLSNGHFVIVDGAQEFSAEPTVEYLESLTPDNQIPIVDAWFLTHAHPDHSYCVWGIGRDEKLVSRIKVEGFYYTWPNDEGMKKESDYNDLMTQVSNINGALEKFKDTDGSVTPRYKLHGGMRFYFDELEVQVLFTQDQIRPSEYGNGFNDTSTSFKFIVHTQGYDDTTFLIMGDASSAICKKLMKMYTANTLHTTFFQSLHHGSNDCLEFFEYIQPDYLNYTHKSDEKGKNKAGYKYLASTCKGVNFSPKVIEISKLHG